MNYKLTIDINLMRESPAIPAMDILKRWMSEGKIELIEAEPPTVPGGAVPPPKPSGQVVDSRWGARTRVKRELPGAAKFKNVAALLFPHKDTQKLNMGEINDVAHLVKHHGSKNELFVTHNRKDFIDNGKRERLKAGYGIVALTPDEVVEMLTRIEGWK